METNEYFMQRALELAEKGRKATGENPMVGAVIVKDGKIVGEGYHKKAGGPHAEIEALKKAGLNAKGAALYVNLEPCCHYGKTPPCTDALIKAQIARVVAAIEDPNSKVAGKGFLQLQNAGIEVSVGVLKDEASKLNEVFIKNISKQTPFVIAKIAQSIDGKIALSSGKSKWITCDAARKRGHEIRSMYDGILVGIGTVLADDPILDCRLASNSASPVKIVLDSSAAIPTDSRLLQSKGKVILATTAQADKGRLKELEERGVEIVTTSQDKVNLKELLKALYNEGIYSILVEGGAGVFTSFLIEGLLDKIIVFISPKIIGGDGKDYVGNLFLREMKDVYDFYIDDVEKVGDDVMLTMYPKKMKGRC